MKKILSTLLISVLLMGMLSGLIVSHAAGYVFADNDMHVRTGPAVSYSSIGTAHKGVSLPYRDETVYDSRGTAWFKVSFGGKIGWVSSAYGSLNGYTLTTDGTLYINGDVNVRTGPSTGYASLGVAAAGTTLKHLGVTSADYRGVAWYKVSFHGSTGWVSSAYSSLKGFNYSAPTTPSTGTAYINANVNVRTGAGIGYTSIGTAAKGTTLTYLGATSVDNRGVAWYKVSYKGGSGWVSSTYVSLTGFNYSTPSNPSTVPTGTAYINSDVNVRTGAGTGYTSIGTVAKGTKLTYLGATAMDSRGVAWYKVSFRGSTGWVSSTYVSLTGFSSSASSSSGTAYINGNVNVRTGAGTGYTSLGTVAKGTKLTYLGATAMDSRGVAWYKVSFRGSVGWVSSTYVSLTGFSSSASSSSGTAYINGNVNVRTGAGTGYASLGTAAKGTKLPYLGSTSTDSRGVKWYKVSFNGSVGWVSSTYASLKGFTSSSSSSGTVKATGGNANVRTGPGLGYSDVATMYQGDSARYLGSSSVDERGVKWYKVSFNGKTGWVSSKYCKLY